MERLVGQEPVRIFDLSPREAELTQRLGAALVVEWSRVPNDLQCLLIQQAADIGIGEQGAQMDLQIMELISKFRQKSDIRE